MEKLEQLLERLVRQLEISLRLQKLSISLQAETLSYIAAAEERTGNQAKTQKRVGKSVQQIRCAMDRLEKGKSLAT